jgi:hypothetical protein
LEGTVKLPRFHHFGDAPEPLKTSRCDFNFLDDLAGKLEDLISPFRLPRFRHRCSDASERQKTNQCAFNFCAFDFLGDL